MALLRTVGGTLMIAGAALAGNWLGNTLRATTTGEAEHQLGLIHTTPDGDTVLGVNVALTNFVPALLLALLAGKPRTLYAFVSGADCLNPDNGLSCRTESVGIGCKKPDGTLCQAGDAGCTCDSFQFSQCLPND